MMTKRERFQNYLASKPVDRVPIAFFHHFCGPAEWGKGLVNADAFERNVVGHKIAREKFDPDVIKIMNDTLMIMPIDVSFVKTPGDLRKVHAPAVDSAFAKKTMELTKRVMAFYEDSDAPKYATGFTPSMVLRTSLGASGISGETPEQLAKVKEFMFAEPEALAEGLMNICKDIAAFNEMLIKEGGVDGIYLSVNNQANFFPDDFYTKYVAPADKGVMTEAEKLSSMNLLHVCGYHGLSNHLDLFKDFGGAAVNIAVYAEGVSLSEGKKIFGGRPVFGGFAQDGVIYTGTKEEVKAETCKILDEMGQVGVMIGDDCTVPNDIDDSRFNWVIEACEEYAASH